ASPNWACSLCTTKTKGRNNDNTPSRSQRNNRPHKRVALNSPPKTDSALTRDDVRDVVQELFINEIENLFIRLGQQIRSSISAELTPIKKEMSALKASITFINEQYDSVIIKLSSVAVEMKEIHEENASLRSVNMDLTAKINELEQYARGNNIEIQLVQFNSPRVRDTFLESSIKFNKSSTNNRLNSSHIGLTGEKTPIFVVEHLSTSNKALHSAARSAAKERGYKFVWVRNGRIYMRKSKTSEYKLIKKIE
ncbi:Uncharacterized protein OBRU01_03278, partial [Operophtera brumata]